MKRFLFTITLLIIGVSTVWAGVISRNVIYGSHPAVISGYTIEGWFGLKTTVDYSTNSANFINMYRFTNSQDDAQVPSLGIKLPVGSGGHSCKLALYDATGNLLCYTNEFETVEGEQDISVTSPIVINSGNFWIAQWSDDAFPVYNELSATENTIYYFYAYSGGFPSSIDVSSPVNTYRRSLYANYLY